MGWLTPSVGDWVRTTRRVPAGFMDRLTGGGLPRGTRGVVVAHAPGLLTSDVFVEYDTGLGGRLTARTPVRHLRSVRVGGGVPAFRQSAGRMAAARAGVAAVFVAPILWFAVEYFLNHHTAHGLLPALMLGMVYGGLDFITYLLDDPGRAVVYLVVTTLAWRFAFRR